MHGTGGPGLHLSSQRQSRGNGSVKEGTSIKSQGTSTSRIEAASESDSDEQTSPLWTRPAHMRNGKLDRSGSGVVDTSSSLARLVLTGDSRFNHSLLRVAAGALVKLSVAEDCDLPHHFEIEKCAGGKVLETPPIVPGSAFTWRPPGPGKYQLVDQVYPWIKSIVSVSPPATLSEASESQPSTPDGPLSVGHANGGLANGVRKKAVEVQSQGASSNGQMELVTQQIEAVGGPGSFGVVARTCFPARAEDSKEETYGGGSEVDDLLRVPLLAKKSNKRKESGEPRSDGQAWNDSWEEGSGDECLKSGTPGVGLRRRAKAEERTQGGTEEQREGTEASLQVRQIINPGEIDEWVERISREEEESCNASPPSEEVSEAANEEAAEKDLKRGGKGHKKRKKKSSGKKEVQPADASSASEILSPIEEDSKAGLLDDPMMGINSLLSSLPSTTGITHYDVSNAGMVKGRPAKLMAIGRSADGKMEVAPISPMMSPSSLMKGGLSNTKFSERSSVVEEDEGIPYHRFEDLIDLESGMGFIEGIEQTRLHEVKNFGGARLPAHLANFSMRDGSGWPLGGPHMSSLVPELPCRLKSCPKKFVSSVSMLRHYLQRHKKQGGDLTSERPTLMAFWADLTKEEQRALLSIKDVNIMGINGEAVSSELVQKARFRKLHGIKGARHMELGERLLNIVFSPVELPPTSAVDFFDALEEASEFTFLRGRTDLAVQRVCVADPLRGLGDEAYLVGLLTFMLEDRLVNAWMKSKEEGAMRTHQALLEEEEQAKKKRQKAQQKKERKKQKRASEQLKQTAQEEPAREDDSDAGSPEGEEEPLVAEQATRSPALNAQVSSTSSVTTAEGGMPAESESAWSMADAEKQWNGSGSSGSSVDSQPSLVQECEGALAKDDSSTEAAPSREDSPTEAALSTEAVQKQDSPGASLDASASEHVPEAGPAEEAEPMQSKNVEVDETVAHEPAAEGLASTADAGPPPLEVSGSSQDVNDCQAGRKVVSPSNIAVAVPVSRMGSKPKSAEALRPSQMPSAAQQGERLVVVTRMGPRARDKARQGSGIVAKGPSEVKGAASGDTGSTIEGGNLQKGALGEAGRSMEPGRSDSTNQCSATSEQAVAARSIIGLQREGWAVSLAGENVKGDVQKAAVESKTSAERQPVDTLGGNSIVADFKELQVGAEANGSENHRESVLLPKASVDDSTAGVAETTGVQHNEERAGTFEVEGPTGEDFVVVPEKETTRPSRRSRNKLRGKHSEGAAPAKEAESGGDSVAGRGGETEWTERATRDLKGLLMGLGASRASRGKESVEAGLVSPVGVALLNEASSLQAGNTREVESESLARAEVLSTREAEVEEVAKSETAGARSEVLGAHKSQGWAGIVAAAAQLEKEHRQQQAEAEEKKRRRKLTREAPAEAWPELTLVAKKGAPASQKRKGKKGEMEGPGRPHKEEESEQPAQEKYEEPKPSVEGSHETTGANTEGEESKQTAQESNGDPKPSVAGSHETAGANTELEERAEEREAQFASAFATEVLIGEEHKLRPQWMAPGEIVAFFGARWHAAVSDPETIYVGQSSATQKEGFGEVSDVKSEAVEPTGWGSPTDSSSTPRITRSAWLVAPNRGDEGSDQVQGAATDKAAEEASKDEEGWQEARGRKGGEARGRRGGQSQKAIQGRGRAKRSDAR